MSSHNTDPYPITPPGVSKTQIYLVKKCGTGSLMWTQSTVWFSISWWSEKIFSYKLSFIHPRNNNICNLHHPINKIWSKSFMISNTSMMCLCMGSWCAGTNGVLSMSQGTVMEQHLSMQGKVTACWCQINSLQLTFYTVVLVMLHRSLCVVFGELSIIRVYKTQYQCGIMEITISGRLIITRRVDWDADILSHSISNNILCLGVT